MGTSPFGGMQPIVDSMRNYTQGLLPMRMAQYGSKLGSLFQHGVGSLESLLGIQGAQNPNAAWHDQQVQNATRSFGARNQGDPVAPPSSVFALKKGK